MSEKVINIIAEQFSVPPHTVTVDTNLKTDLHADSIELVELAMSLEDAFGLTVDDDGSLPELATVADVIAYINRLLG